MYYDDRTETTNGPNSQKAPEEQETSPLLGQMEKLENILSQERKQGNRQDTATHPEQATTNRTHIHGLPQTPGDIANSRPQYLGNIIHQTDD